MPKRATVHGSTAAIDNVFYQYSNINSILLTLACGAPDGIPDAQAAPIYGAAFPWMQDKERYRRLEMISRLVVAFAALFLIFLKTFRRAGFHPGGVVSGGWQTGRE
ncbi:hypothetical protein G3A39_33525 [Paraburkholderia aspalathi]|uniref:hypothetical protein n=1 Tax=Paraburkholderia nemoris TaxID=2793076 RepID=UPI001909D2AA|nr:hypothetical protein [Paraburkholderia nemoris]MBK3744146.1 hypothetical protein [Paraburkholderia aspalathi]